MTSRRVRTLVIGLAGLAGLAALVAVAVSLAGGAATPPDHAGPSFGVAVGGPWAGLTDAEVDQQTQGLATLGVSWVRFDLNWSVIQRGGPDSYDWSTFDRAVTAARSHHIRVLAVVSFTPAWARERACADTQACPPADHGDFARFVHAAASRFDTDRVAAWEIWNEPNSSLFWQPKADPRAYTALLKAAYPAIKSVRPAAVVLTGGTSASRNDAANFSADHFVAALYRDGAKGSFDAVAVHPYTFPALPASPDATAWRAFTAGDDSVRGIMISNGDEAKRIWLTEFGAPSSGRTGVRSSESSQDAILRSALAQYRGIDYAGPMFWFTYVDPAVPPQPDGGTFGLVRRDGTKRPSYYDFQAAIRAAEKGSPPPGEP
jgi:hypothetical protein